MKAKQPRPDRTRWHRHSVDDVIHMLGTHPRDGLSDEEAARRFVTYGPNELPAPARRSALLRFMLQMHQPLIYILLASSAITFFLGEFVDSGVIMGVV